MIDEDQPLDVPIKYAVEKIGSLQVLRIGAYASYVVFNGEYIRFYHQLIMEYFAAAELDQRNVTAVITTWREKAWSAPLFGSNPQERKRALSAPRNMYGGRYSEKWDQVIISLGGLTATPETHIRELITVDTYLAAVWLTSCVKVSPSVYDEILTILLSEADRNPMFAAVSVFPLLVDTKELRVINPLIKLLAHDNFHRVGSRTSNLLVRLGAEAVPPLIEALNDPNSEVRVRVTAILGKIRDKRTVPALIKALSDTGGSGWGKPSYTCDEAAKALQLIGTPEALEAVEKWQANLINKLIGLETETRSNLWSIQEMFEWSPDGFRQALSKVFDTDKVLELTSSLSVASVQAIGIIGNPAAIPSLEHALQIPLYYNDSKMLSAILTALERIGTPEARTVITNWKSEGKG